MNFDSMHLKMQEAVRAHSSLTEITKAANVRKDSNILKMYSQFDSMSILVGEIDENVNAAQLCISRTASYLNESLDHIMFEIWNDAKQKGKSPYFPIGVDPERLRKHVDKMHYIPKNVRNYILAINAADGEHLIKMRTICNIMKHRSIRITTQQAWLGGNTASMGWAIEYRDDMERYFQTYATPLEERMRRFSEDSRLGIMRDLHRDNLLGMSLRYSFADDEGLDGGDCIQTLADAGGACEKITQSIVALLTE